MWCKLMFAADIDIDVAPGTKREQYGVRAIIYDGEKQHIKPHPSGHYVECGMPKDVFTGQATIDYETAEAWGFNKVDLLINSSYGMFTSKDEVRKLVAKEPDWTLLELDEYLECMPQIYNARTIIRDIKPKSIEDLADVLALMRPGKIELLETYKKDKAFAREMLYTKTTKVYFKRSHAIAYASMLVCFLNKLEEIAYEL